jgi:hypothetical protein
MGCNEAVLDLWLQPTREPVHDGATVCLVGCEALLGPHLLPPRLVLMVEYLRERVDHDRALLRKHLLQCATLAPTVGQTVTAHQGRFVRCMACERLGHDQGGAVLRGTLGQQRLQVLPGMRAT